MRVTSVQTSTFFFQNANHPCVQSCGSDEMAAQRFSNPQKASSYFVCGRVFEKGNEKGMCIRICDVSPFLWLFAFDFFRTEREMLYAVIGHQTASQSPRDMSSLTTSSWRSWIREWWTERKGLPNLEKAFFSFRIGFGYAVHHFSDTISTPENSPKIREVMISSSLYENTSCVSISWTQIHRIEHGNASPRRPKKLADHPAEGRFFLLPLHLGFAGFLGLQQPLHMGNGWVPPPPITLLMCSWVFPLLDLENGKIESECRDVVNCY